MAYELKFYANKEAQSSVDFELIRERINQLAERFLRQFSEAQIRPELLAQALLFPAVSGPEYRYKSNETLEMLGDAILDAIIVKRLWLRYAHLLRRGDFSIVRSEWHANRTLASIAQKIGLADFLLLHAQQEQEIHQKRLGNTNLLAALAESLIGAIYLSAGEPGAEAFLTRSIFPHLRVIPSRELHQLRNPLETLALMGKSSFGQLPQFVDEVVEGNPPQFRTQIFFGKATYGTELVADTKKKAHLLAAQSAIQEIRETFANYVVRRDPRESPKARIGPYFTIDILSSIP